MLNTSIQQMKQLKEKQNMSTVQQQSQDIQQNEQQFNPIQQYTQSLNSISDMSTLHYTVESSSIEPDLSLHLAARYPW